MHLIWRKFNHLFKKRYHSSLQVKRKYKNTDLEKLSCSFSYSCVFGALAILQSWVKGVVWCSFVQMNWHFELTDYDLLQSLMSVFRRHKLEGFSICSDQNQLVENCLFIFCDLFSVMSGNFNLIFGGYFPLKCVYVVYLYLFHMLLKSLHTSYFNYYILKITKKLYKFYFKYN